MFSHVTYAFNLRDFDFIYLEEKRETKRTSVRPVTRVRQSAPDDQEDNWPLAMAVRRIFIHEAGLKKKEGAFLEAGK